VTAARPLFEDIPKSPHFTVTFLCLQVTCVQDVVQLSVLFIYELHYILYLKIVRGREGV
jgi:hypothetical protein